MSEGSRKISVLKVILPVVGVLAAAVLALSLLKKQGDRSHAPGTIAQGQTIEDVELTVFGNGRKRLSEFKGKVFLVNFWASWCSACLVEMPSIVRLWREFKDQGLEVLAVDVDENPDRVVPGIAKRLSMEFPILIDPDNQLADLFDVHAIPTTVILNRDRKVLLIDSGERDWSSPEVREQMKRWLSSK
jgi:thiol-disulfide isomerase/thioredoxin